MKCFRKRYQFYHATHKDVETLDQKDAMKLTSAQRISNEELKALEHPDTIENIHSIYASIMQNGNSTWKAYAFLKSMKRQEPGFDFRVHFDN